MAPPHPIPLKDRVSILFVQRGRLDVRDGAFVLVGKDRERTHVPVGGLACLMLEPGVRVSHAAVALAARVGCLLIWVGEAGVRLYSAGQPGGARADRLLHQARLALDPDARLKVVRKMYGIRANRSRSSTTWPTCSSSTPWFPSRFKWPEKQSAERHPPSTIRSVRSDAAAVTSFERLACSGD